MKEKTELKSNSKEKDIMSKFEKIIKKIVHASGDTKVIVTGSYALAMMGLLDWEKVNDLDIVLIQPSEELKAKFKNSMELHPADTKPMGDYETSVLGLLAIYKDGDVKVDIFVESVERDCIDLAEGYSISTIPKIVKAKMVSNRLKDWARLRFMAKIIYDVDVFNNKLNSLL